MIEVTGRGVGMDIKFKQFPNKELYLIGGFYNDLKVGVMATYPKINWKFEDNTSILELMFFVNYLKDNKLFKPMELNILYLPYSRMDRIEEGHKNLFSLKYIADIINGFGFDKVRLNEIHSDVALKLINNSYNKYYTDYLFHEVLYYDIEDRKDLTVMFPDKGAYNRYKDKYKDYNIVYGEKVRDFNSGKILGLELNGSKEITKDVIIVDDLTSKGTTFIKSAEKLKEQGFENIYLVVGHAEYTMLEGDLFNSNIDKVYTTNSIIDKSNTEVIKLVDKNKLKVYDTTDTDGLILLSK